MEGDSGEEECVADADGGSVGDGVGEIESVDARGYCGSSMKDNSSILTAGADVFVVAVVDDDVAGGGVEVE